MGTREEREDARGRRYQDALAKNRAGVRPENNPKAMSRNGQGNAQTSREAEASGWGDEQGGSSSGAKARSSFTTKMIALVGVGGIALAIMLQFKQTSIKEQREFGGRDVWSTASSVVSGLGLSAAGMSSSAGSEEAEACEPNEDLKTMGTQWLDQSSYAGKVPMTVRNRTNQIAFLDMRVVGSMEQATTLVVMPGDAIRFPLAGKGAVGSVSVGLLWCNRKVGWKDGRRTEIRPAVIAGADTTEIKALVYERGGGLVGVRFFSEKADKQAPEHFR